MSRKIRLHAHRIFNSRTALGRGPKIQSSEPTSDLERIPDQVRSSREIRRVPNFGSERTSRTCASLTSMRPSIPGPSKSTRSCPPRNRYHRLTGLYWERQRHCPTRLDMTREFSPTAKEGPMKSLLLLTASGPLLILTSHEFLTRSEAARGAQAQRDWQVRSI